MTRVFAYGRASTDKQQITLESQEDTCQKWFDLQIAQGLEYEWAGWFPDAAVTSCTPWFERPMGNHCITSAVNGDIILVSNFDRAFRSVIDCDKSLKRLEQSKIAIVLLDVDVNTKTPLGKAFMKIIAVLKELERDEISRRTREALQTKKRNNLPVNTYAPIGWRKEGIKGESRYVPFPEMRAVCNEIVRLKDKGIDFMTMRQWMKAKMLDKYLPGQSQWAVHRLRYSYSAAKLGFPRITQHELPPPSELPPHLRIKKGGANALILPPASVRVERLDSSPLLSLVKDLAPYSA